MNQHQHCSKNGVTNANTTHNMSIIPRKSNKRRKMPTILAMLSIILFLNINGSIITEVQSFSIGNGNNGGGRNNNNNNNNNNNENNYPILPLLATAAVIASPKSKSLLLSSSSTTASGTATKTKLDNDNNEETTSSSIFSIVTKIFKKEETKVEDSKPPKITSITIQNSTLLPPNIISYARTRSNIVGSSDPVSSIQLFSKYIREWYAKHGYILNSISNVHVTNDGECIISVKEYKTSEIVPLEFVFVKPMIYDNSTENYLTLKQYRSKELEKSSSLESKNKYTKREDFPNVTYIIPQQQQGVSSSSSIKATNKWYKALKVQPGKDFIWDEVNWKEKSSRYFSSLIRNVLQVQPKLLDDGSVCLQLIVEENPMKSLEYGVTRSLYTGTWEGEINFQHNNVFGSGEKLGVVIQRSPSEVTNLQKEPSWNIYYRDDKLGCDNAYSISLFNDFVSQAQDNKQQSTPSSFSTATPLEDKLDNGVNQEQEVKVAAVEEEPLIRRGMTFQLYPFKNRMISYMKLNMERICMNKGTSNEHIISSQWEIGPFQRSSTNSNILQSIGVNMNSGIRFKELPIFRTTTSITSNTLFTPFSAMTLKLQHIINNPISKLLNSDNNKDGDNIKLAFQQKISTYSNELPTHEQNALFLSSPIRGTTTDFKDYITSSTTTSTAKTLVSGMAEIRFPTWNIPIKEYNFNIDCLLFHDWLIHCNTTPLSLLSTTPTSSSSSLKNKNIFKHSFGIGLRKVIQGIPIKFDICYDIENNQIKNVFGLGRDFDL